MPRRRKPPPPTQHRALYRPVLTRAAGPLPLLIPFFSTSSSPFSLPLYPTLENFIDPTHTTRCIITDSPWLTWQQPRRGGVVVVVVVVVVKERRPRFGGHKRRRRGRGRQNSCTCGQGQEGDDNNDDDAPSSSSQSSIRAITPPQDDGFPRFEPIIRHPAQSPITPTPPPPHLPPTAIQSWPDTATMASLPTKAADRRKGPPLLTQHTPRIDCT